MGIRIEAIGGMFSALVAIAVVYGKALDTGSAGYALSQVLAFSLLIMWFVRLGNFAEVECEIPVDLMSYFLLIYGFLTANW